MGRAITYPTASRGHPHLLAGSFRVQSRLAAVKSRQRLGAGGGAGGRWSSIPSGRWPIEPATSQSCSQLKGAFLARLGLGGRRGPAQGLSAHVSGDALGSPPHRGALAIQIDGLPGHQLPTSLPYLLDPTQQFDGTADLDPMGDQEQSAIDRLLPRRCSAPLRRMGRMAAPCA